VIEALWELTHGWLVLFLVATAIGIAFVAIGNVPRLSQWLGRGGKTPQPEPFYGELPQGHPLLQALQARGAEEDGTRLKVVSAMVEVATIRVVNESGDGESHVVRYRLSDAIKTSLRTGAWPPRTSWRLNACRLTTGLQRMGCKSGIEAAH